MSSLRVLVLVFGAACTHGDLCDSAHPCSGSNTCVSGVCTGSSTSLSPTSGQQIPLNTCAHGQLGFGYCTVSCDYSTGICPSNLYGDALTCTQIGAGNAGACYEFDGGAANPTRCNTDADCIGQDGEEM